MVQFAESWGVRAESMDLGTVRGPNRARARAKAGQNKNYYEYDKLVVWTLDRSFSDLTFSEFTFGELAFSPLEPFDVYLLHVDFLCLLSQGLGKQHKGMGMASSDGPRLRRALRVV